MFFVTAFLTGGVVAAFSVAWLRHDQAVHQLRQIARAIREDAPVVPSQLAIAEQTSIALDRDHALWPSDLDDAGLVATSFAGRNTVPLLAPPLLVTAEHFLVERLRLAPADGNSWLRLAFVRTARLNRVDTLVHEALRMSWLVTPREFAVMWPGLRFRVDHWRDMDNPERTAAADLAAGIWHKPPARPDILAYMAKLPPDQRKDLLAHMFDQQARIHLENPR